MGTIWVQFFLRSLEALILLGFYMVELVGIEPTTSSLRTMRSAKKHQFGVHLAANYGPKRSNSDRFAGGCPTTFWILFSGNIPNHGRRQCSGRFRLHGLRTLELSPVNLLSRGPR